MYTTESELEAWLFFKNLLSPERIQSKEDKYTLKLTHHGFYEIFGSLALKGPVSLHDREHLCICLCTQITRRRVYVFVIQFRQRRIWRRPLPTADTPRWYVYTYIHADTCLCVDIHTCIPININDFINSGFPDFLYFPNSWISKIPISRYTYIQKYRNHLCMYVCRKTSMNVCLYQSCMNMYICMHEAMSLFKVTGILKPKNIK